MYKQLKAFLRGCIGFCKPLATMHESWQELEAYELGREGMHRLTFRRYEVDKTSSNIQHTKGKQCQSN